MSSHVTNHTTQLQIDILCDDHILGKDHTLKFVFVTHWRFKVSVISCRVMIVTDEPFLNTAGPTPEINVQTKTGSLLMESYPWTQLYKDDVN